MHGGRASHAAKPEHDDVRRPHHLTLPLPLPDDLPSHDCSAASSRGGRNGETLPGRGLVVRLIVAGRLGERFLGNLAVAGLRAIAGAAVEVDAGAQLGRGVADAALDLLHHVGVGLEELLGVLAALAESLLIEVVPSAALAHDAEIGGDVEHASRFRDALVIHDVELSLTEGWRDLVLDYLDARAHADRVLPILDGLDTADVAADRSVELEGVTTGGGLRVAEHDADLHAQLVDEDHGGARAADRAGQLTQRLAHEK